MEFVLYFIISIFNYQEVSNLSLLYSNNFYERETPLPSFTKYQWIDITPFYTLISAGKDVHIGKLSAGGNIIIKRGDKDIYPYKLWNNLFAADYNTLYLRYKNKHFTFILGRLPIRWSPSPLGSLVFTGYEPGMDLIYYRISTKKLSLDWFFSPLFDSEPIRYLAAHRVLIKPLCNVQITFKDIILYKTTSNVPDFYYFNPLAIYYVRQWTLDSSGLTNSIFDFTGEILKKNAHLYGELMIDDFPYIKVYHENPRMGIIGGIVYRKRDIAMLSEYVRVNRFTYCYYTFAPYMGYRFINMPLGHPDGNDFDKITLLMLKQIKQNNTGIMLFYKRHGKGTLDETYKTTSEESEHYFLSGIVEKTISLSAILMLNFHKTMLYLLPSASHIKNYRHKKGYSVNLLRLSMGMRFNF